MRITMRRSVATTRASFAKGRTYTVTDETGRQFVRNGWAVAALVPPTEAATVETQERAVVPRAKGRQKREPDAD